MVYFGSDFLSFFTSKEWGSTEMGCFVYRVECGKSIDEHRVYLYSIVNLSLADPTVRLNMRGAVALLLDMIQASLIFTIDP